MADQLKRFSFNTGQIRGVGAKLSQGLFQLISNHKYPTTIQALVGELTVCTIMLKSIMDFAGQLHVHARGNGSIQLLSAECDESLRFRALAQSDSNLAANEPLGALLGSAQFALTTLPTNGPQYQGIVPLESATLSGCFEDYFKQSEQIATRLWLASDGKNAAGLLVQQLPAAQIDDPDEWNRITTLASTLNNEELLSLPIDEWLLRLFSGEEIRIYETRTPEFHCSCSRDRFAQKLATLEAKELSTILAEDGCIDIQCEFCQTNYSFTAADFS